jgi:DNA-binding CsgD family transcriptional regulator
MEPFYTQHIVYEAFDAVKQICAPLNTIGIKGFVYKKLYHDGSFIDLATDAAWGDFYFKKFFDCEYDLPEVHEHHYYMDNVLLWELNQNNMLWHDAKEQFGHANGISIYKHHDKFTEIYCFYGERDHHTLNDFYVNNLDLLKRFAVYFNEQAADLIARGEKYKLKTPTHYCSKQPQIAHRQPQLDFEKFFHDTGTRIYAINPNNHLTPRELECLHWLSLGKTNDEMASILSITPRTIKAHVRHMKDKLECKNQFQLGEAYNRFKFLINLQQQNNAS